MASDFRHPQPLDVTWDDVTRARSRKTVTQRLWRTLLRVVVVLSILFSVLLYSLYQASSEQSDVALGPSVEGIKKGRLRYFLGPALPAPKVAKDDPNSVVSQKILCRKMAAWTQKSAVQVGANTSVSCRTVGE
jgi:hypothetical protein